MGHKNKESLVYQIKKTLDAKLAIGQSKHAAKKAGVANKYIYSWSTYRAYMQHANYFAKYCKEIHRCRTLTDCRQYVDEWLASRANLSAYTQKLEASALAKLYDCKTTDFVQTGVRHRADITRSRGEKIRDSHFSETKNHEFVEFCRATGLRRSELMALRGSQGHFKDDKYYIRVKGKGGRFRDALVLDNAVIERIQAAGNNKVWDKIPNGADIHSYRAYYCTAIYNKFARQREDIPQEDRYCCRGDLAGTWYDKPAMLIASEMLGHNRISVIAGHYLRS